MQLLEGDDLGTGEEPSMYVLQGLTKQDEKRNQKNKKNPAPPDLLLGSLFMQSGFHAFGFVLSIPFPSKGSSSLTPACALIYLLLTSSKYHRRDTESLPISPFRIRINLPSPVVMCVLHWKVRQNND